MRELWFVVILCIIELCKNCVESTENTTAYNKNEFLDKFSTNLYITETDSDRTVTKNVKRVASFTLPTDTKSNQNYSEPISEVNYESNGKTLVVTKRIESSTEPIAEVTHENNGKSVTNTKNIPIDSMPMSQVTYESNAEPLTERIESSTEPIAGVTYKTNRKYLLTNTKRIESSTEPITGVTYKSNGKFFLTNTKTIESSTEPIAEVTSESNEKYLLTNTIESSTEPIAEVTYESNGKYLLTNRNRIETSTEPIARVTYERNGKYLLTNTNRIESSIEPIAGVTYQNNEKSVTNTKIIQRHSMPISEVNYESTEKYLTNIETIESSPQPISDIQSANNKVNSKPSPKIDSLVSSTESISDHLSKNERYFFIESTLNVPKRSENLNVESYDNPTVDYVDYTTSTLPTLNKVTEINVDTVSDNNNRTIFLLKINTTERRLSSVAHNRYAASITTSTESTTSSTESTTSSAESTTSSTESTTSSTETTPPVCNDLVPPTLSTRNLLIIWNITQNGTENCIPNILTITCDEINLNITLKNLDKNWVDISNFTDFQRGTQYSCSALIIMEDDTETGTSNTILVPSGSNMNVRVINNVIYWDHPFDDTDLSYNITITQLVSNHYLPNQCIDNNNQAPYINSTNQNFWNFTEGLADYNYSCEVITSFWDVDFDGSVNFTTNTAIPAAPNVSLTIENSETLDSYLSVELPCLLNGPIDYVLVNITEAYTEDLQYSSSTARLTESNLRLNLTLKPSYIYNILTNIILQDGTMGITNNTSFTTQSGFPGQPDLHTTNVSNTSFVVNWSAPTEKVGPIQQYEINITSLDPLYTVAERCPIQKNSVTGNLNADIFSFQYNKSLPFNSYKVELRAFTARGPGSFTEIYFNTTEGVPSPIENISKHIDNPLTETYQAVVTIKFEEICYSYGKSVSYIIDCSGVHDTDSYHIINASEAGHFDFALKPEYSYTCNIATNNGKLENHLRLEFSAPPGVPIFSSDIQNISVTTRNLQSAEITLKKEYFVNENGDTKYIALILGEHKPNNSLFSLWNGIDWPQTWSGGRELTPTFWYPFNDVNQKVFVIGNSSQCESIGVCNDYLHVNTPYYLTIRSLNNGFYRDSEPIYFIINKSNTISTILGVTFGILAFAIIGLVGFISWKKRLYKKFPQVYPRKSIIKPVESSPTAVTVKKFNHYFKNAQSKPEILKEQFNLLVENSKEIQSQKTIHFAGLLENRRKNRYVNISPYDDTRVKLLIEEDDEIGSDYINASYIKGYTGNIEYIATQGPLPGTCRDFWKMVIQENVSIIVMVSNFVEKNKEKCYKYFPNNHENLIVSDDIEIRCSTELHFGTYLVRNLQIRKDTFQVTVTHMQFTEWPDFNVPVGTEHMLQFIYQLRERVKIEKGLVIVHCSAGVGRTGTLIAADILLQNVNAAKQIDVFNTVLNLRKQRVMMVQTEEQYIYLHRLVADHIDRPPSPDSGDSDPVYENMDILTHHLQSGNNSKKRDEESEF